ncbi:hypothetical protein, partial [Cryobacterium fucosi]|uniref:hypothetical protein n=1 Tax=Cryobacterium fucosi TaxID=1259157 RepID=UPI0018E08E29
GALVARLAAGPGRALGATAAANARPGAAAGAGAGAAADADADADTGVRGAAGAAAGATATAAVSEAEMIEAVRWATVASSLSVSRPGATRSMPTLAEVTAILR